ncbi:hypothetical protein [Massilia sp. Root351]|nr:hypothetical protein [Massilia sp. Root351]
MKEISPSQTFGGLPLTTLRGEPRLERFRDGAGTPARHACGRAA